MVSIKSLFKLYSLVMLALLLLAAPVTAQDIPSSVFQVPQTEQLAEGRTYEFSWNPAGIRSVSIEAAGELISIPGRPRGPFKDVIADSIPAEVGGVSWTVPFLDTMDILVTLKAYDGNGQLVDSREVSYLFRPEVLRTRTEDGIYIDVRNPDRQRMYVLKGNRVIRAYLTSGSLDNEYYPPNVHPKKPHDHYGVFRVQNKYRNWFSRAFQVDMPWAMRYLNGHFIHATVPQYYEYLGTAASSGCNRLHWDNAKELYDMTPVGTRVEIIVR